jgi:L,D-peptidoglycan transpeptidase YkuD (ErfK/YbiS/YcfS/YnhG family)
VVVGVVVTSPVDVVATVVDVVVTVVDGGEALCCAHAVRRMRPANAMRTVLTVAVLLVAACGSDAPTMRVAAVPTITTSAAAPVATTTTTRPAPTTTRAPRPIQITAPGSQAIVVRAAEYGATSATLTAYSRTASGWKLAHGPWPAFVGREGIAPPGEKREGDGRTPSGTYGFDFMFGIDENPGVRLPYRVITGPNIVWVEDSNSPNYNRWVDSNTEDIGNQSDNMYKPPYRYGVVVAYNTVERTPGLGSGIFLHISTGKPTAGCVSLPVDRLLRVLRWLDPASTPVIVINAG